MSQTKNAAVFAAALRTLVVFIVLVAAPGAQATLIGTTVGGQLAGVNTITVGQQFSSPARVDGTDAPEFSGTADDLNQSPLDVSVNILAESFVIDTQSSGQWGTQANDGFMIMLTDLEWFGAPGVITDVTFNRGWGDTAAWDLTNARLISFDADSIDIQLVLTRPASGRAWFEFDISASHTIVPEPATAALMFLGLVGTAFRRRAAL